jgi:hypothetical protein
LLKELGMVGDNRPQFGCGKAWSVLGVTRDL